MRRLRIKRQIKRTKVIMLVVILVFFFTSVIFKLYSNKANDNIITMAKLKITEFMESFLSNNIGYDILNKSDLEDILIINKNDAGEILYVNYDLDKAYNVLDIVTTKLSELINDLETGKFDGNYPSIYKGKERLALKVPLFISSNNILLASLGPSIYVPVNFIGTILTNIKSEIKDYGMNNALVELYITIKVTTNLASPVTSENHVIDYDVLVASTVINGRVPEIYGGMISTKSNLFSIPIEE